MVTAAFPEIRTFKEIFPKSCSYKSPAPTLATVNAWDEGEPATISGYLYVNDPNNIRSLSVTTKKKIISWMKEDMVFPNGDTIYFEAIFNYGDGTASIWAKHNKIIGSRLLAVIDLSTIPAN